MKSDTWNGGGNGPHRDCWLCEECQRTIRKIRKEIKKSPNPSEESK